MSDAPRVMYSAIVLPFPFTNFFDKRFGKRLLPTYQNAHSAFLSSFYLSASFGVSSAITFMVTTSITIAPIGFCGNLELYRH